MVKRIVLLYFILLSAEIVFSQKFEPNWDSLDSRTLPDWYDNAKFGIFVHWGVYSVPSFGSEWFWHLWKTEKEPEYQEFMRKYYPPEFTYQEFARDFRAEFFNATEWIDLFKKAGAKYVVMTSKHHDGYSMWPSKHSFGWNSRDIGSTRDLVGELVQAALKRRLKYGLYYSLYEWYNPMYVSDKRSKWTKKEYVYGKVLPELKELIDFYSPEILWSDGEWEAPSEYWNATEFLTWLYNESNVKDTVVTNDRWGKDTLCKHGGFFTCTDRFNPESLQPFKWENAMTVDKTSWGYRRNLKLDSILTADEIIRELVVTVSCGGNLLLNVGPTKEGTIIPIFQERLTQIGEWLSINGEAIYGTSPWVLQNDSLADQVWYTKNEYFVYAIGLFWPDNNKITLGSAADLFPDKNSCVLLLEGVFRGFLKYTKENDLVHILLPTRRLVNNSEVFVLKIVPKLPE